MTYSINRRGMLKGSAMALAAAPFASAAKADVPAGQDGYQYEVVKTEDEWRAQLGEYDYNILRMGGTEEEGSSPLWDDYREGSYTCKGCDLPLYTGSWRIKTAKKWLFYRQSEPNSLLMNIDWPAAAERNPAYGNLTSIEVHCRRCGSHVGHILEIEGHALHCIDGASLNFAPEAA